ncbi:MAG: alkaline shock response membrane anchor protein AmaP [Bacillota bacterium]
MNIVDRLLLVIYTFLLAAFSVVVTMASLGWRSALDYMVTVATSGNTRWAAALTGVVFFAISVKLLYMAFRRRYHGQTVVHETPLGEVRVSLDAVEALVKRVVRQIDGVRDVKALVTTGSGLVDVELRVAVSPEVSIPGTSEDIQSAVKNQVRNVVGVNVGSVKVYVENITNETRRTRVE